MKLTKSLKFGLLLVFLEKEEIIAGGKTDIARTSWWKESLTVSILNLAIRSSNEPHKSFISIFGNRGINFTQS